MNKKPGRNDPCHCGSGKKYKRCHLEQDETAEWTAARVAREREETDVPGAAEESAPGQTAFPRLSSKQAERLRRQLKRGAPKGAGKPLDEFLSRTQEVVDFATRQGEIDAACKALEAHRETFDKLVEDDKAYGEMAHVLFAEEQFKPLWFTAEEVDRACRQTGFDAQAVTPESTEKLEAAIQFLCGKERRTELAMKLMLLLPGLVAAGRFLEGCLVESCAALNVDFLDESNPFLFEMFSHGHDALGDRVRASQEAILREAGLDMDQLMRMTPGEAELWIQEHSSPEHLARWEAVMNQHPEEVERLTASMRNLEHDAVHLLDREDAAHFLLSDEEMAPWLPRLAEAFAKSPLAALPQEIAADEERSKALFDALLPVLREAAAAIFTPERRKQLLAQLQAYHIEKMDAGDYATANLARGAITYVSDEDEPGLNKFLVGICLHSLRGFAGQDREAEGEEADSEEERPG